MINAIISETTLGCSQDNLPFAILKFSYKGSENKRNSISTKPIFLVNPESETVENSAAAATILTILSTVGVPCWEEIVGKVVRINITENQEVETITNAIEDNYIKLMVQVPSENEAAEINADIVD